MRVSDGRNPRSSDLNHSLQRLGITRLSEPYQIKPMKNKKWIVLLLAFNLCSHADVFGQKQIASDVYPGKTLRWKRQKPGRSAPSSKAAPRILLQWKSPPRRSTRGKGEAEMVRTSLEQMVVVKDGSLKITINGRGQTVGRGSVAIMMPGDQCSLTNAADGETAFLHPALSSRKLRLMQSAEKKSGGLVHYGLERCE